MSKVKFGGVQPNPKESKVWLHPHDGLKTYNQKKQEWTGGGSSNDATTDEPESLYEFVDLGLPSGTLWATCNIGATKPEEYGFYFQWGDTQGYEIKLGDMFNAEWGGYNINETLPKAKRFDEATYKWFNSETNNYIKYNDIDNLFNLEELDDAAKTAYSKMRMPTEDECKELTNKENTIITTEYIGLSKVLKITSKTNGNSIYVPCSGQAVNSQVGGINMEFWTWFNKRWEDNTNVRQAGTLSITDESVDFWYVMRWYGHPIRPVQDK